MLWNVWGKLLNRGFGYWRLGLLASLPTKLKVGRSARLMEEDHVSKTTRSLTSGTPRLELTLKERELFDLLLEVGRKNSLSTTMRIAGGWVRDKFLGLSSTDIDVALDNMMGKDFAVLVNQYLKEHHLPTHHIGVIQTNPEQSKHLETASVHVLDFWIDFVNLRSEVYSQDSRIPSKIAFGTPVDDALRRDITINALFYNVNTDCVEDFTGKGLEDLRSGIIRTPLPPLETFRDDPLRVLRVIRFASRLNYKIEKDVWKAIHHPEVVKALREKISRERIGTEIAKMLQGMNPFLSVTLLVEANIFDVVFLRPMVTTHPSLALASESIAKDALGLARIVDTILHGGESYFSGKSNWSFAHHDRRLVYLATLLAPLRNSKILDKNKKPIEEFMVIIKDSLKLATKDAMMVQQVLVGVDKVQECIRRNVSLSDTSRKELGCMIRQLGSTWTLSLVIAFALEKWQDEVSPHLSLYSQFADRVQEVGVSHAFEIKPLLDGNCIKEALTIDHGPLIGYYHEKMIEWQLEHPHGSKEDCLAWLKHNFEQHKRDQGTILSPALARKKPKTTLGS